MRKSTCVAVAAMAISMALNPLVGAARVGAEPATEESPAAIDAGVSEVASDPLPSTITDSGLEADSDGIQVSVASDPSEGLAVVAGDAPEVAVGVPLASSATDATFVDWIAKRMRQRHRRCGQATGDLMRRRRTQS